jgi:hypothetical protein
MSDATSIDGAAQSSPFVFSAPNGSGAAIIPGEILTPQTGGSAGTLGKASSASAQLGGMCGVATINVASGGIAYCQWGGLLALTTAQWDAATADSSTTGLSPGKYYYASATAGKMTMTAPGSGVVAPIGIAISATTLLILPQVPVAAG